MCYTGNWWEVAPNQPRMHYHRCDVCGSQAAFPVVYPRTEFLQEASQ